MLELDFTFWSVLWTVMGAAFICAWFFIVLGCRKIDSGSDEVA